MTYIKKMVMQGFKSFAKRTEVIFDTGINTVVGPNGSGKCMTGDTIVQLADGSMQKIENLVDSRISKSIKIDDGFIAKGDGTKIMSLNLESYQIETKETKAFIKRTSPDKLLRIKTKSGREIKSTKYHPFFILKNDKIIAIKAEDIKEGIKIAVPLGDFNSYFEQIIESNNSNLIAIKSQVMWDELIEIEE